MIEPVRPERHYDLVVRPPGPEEPACDCVGPPPEFLLPPPPVDPAWAAPDDHLCVVVAPYQTCRVLKGLLPGADLQGLFTVMPNNAKPAGFHIEMVAVKGQCPQLMPGGAGALFVYPPPPSLTDDGSECMSNMYEEIPYYGRPAPSVSYCSDSDDDVSRPSDDDLRAERRRHAYIPVNSDDGGDVRYVLTMPAGAARPPAQPRRGQRRPKSADRRRQSPISPVWGPSRANPARRDESLRRKDPYYYSDLLERDRGDVGRPGSRGSPYGRPCDERRSPSQGLMYCQPDVTGVGIRSSSRGPRDVGDLRSPHDPGHVSPLAGRIALDPLVDMYDGDRGTSHRPRHKRSSFRGYSGGGRHGQAAPAPGVGEGVSRAGSVSVSTAGDRVTFRYRPSEASNGSSRMDR